MASNNWRKDEYPFDLGNYAREVTINVKSKSQMQKAKQWFDRGLIW